MISVAWEFGASVTKYRCSKDCFNLYNCYSSLRLPCWKRVKRRRSLPCRQRRADSLQDRLQRFLKPVVWEANMSVSPNAC